MTLATFPSTIINPDQGTLVLQVYLTKKELGGKQTILLFGNHQIYSLNNLLDIKESDTIIDIELPEEIDSDYNDPTLTQGYNTILISWEEQKLKLMLHNKNGFFLNHFELFENLSNMPIEFDESFKGTYVLLSTSETSLYYHNNEELEDLVISYNFNYLDKVINKDILMDNPHPFFELLSSDNNIFYRDFRESNIRYAIKPFLEATPAPLDDSPILVEDNEGFLYRQYFFDFESGEYTTTNTETFTITDIVRFELSYEKIDKDWPLLIFIEEEHFQNYSLEGNILYLHLESWQHDLFYGKEITITYKLDRAYLIEYNEDAAHYSYKLKLTDEDSRPITVTQEGNSHSKVRLATELELNPIVNPQHTGFIYIDKEEQDVHDFRLNASSSYLIADGMDSADFTIEAIDQNGNEVLSPYLDVFITDKYNAIQVKYGSLTPIINEDTLKARRTSGRLYFKYRAPLYTEKSLFKDELFLNVKDRKSGLGSQISIRLRAPIHNVNQIINYSEEISPAASIPFEYFARYYKQTIKSTHPIAVYDYNKDNYLDREDWLKFIQDINDTAKLEAVSQELIEQEEF